ncbi:hypothetical protein EDD22DRAFT_848881 [Suillus occidentalis]|nr:hypothetical protein EDD22DRAFT_848881 [Suillus occidentalis]
MSLPFPFSCFLPCSLSLTFPNSSTTLNSCPGGTTILPHGTPILSTSGSGGAEALFIGGVLDADSIKHFVLLVRTVFLDPVYWISLSIILCLTLTFLPSDKGNSSRHL